VDKDDAVANDPVVVGQIPGVASRDCDEDGKTVMFLDGIFDLKVAGIDSSGTSGADGNVAVNAGDQIYFDSSKTPKLSKRAGGVPFGKAWGDDGDELVASGATTTTIPVLVGR
jgi:hypothetical protein